MIDKIVKYGVLTYQDTEADNFRREYCLCLKCSNLKPESENNCKIAQSLFEICKENGVATMVSRCKEFKE